MATKFRKDIDATDIHLAARFKSHLLGGLDDNFIEKTYEHKLSYLQQWEERSGEWRAARRISDTKAAYGITLQEFRWIVRMIQREVDIREGRIVHVLEKMSLFRYPKTVGGWKTDSDPPQVLLEHDRFFGAGTIRKRRPNSPSALLEKADEDIEENLKRGLSREQATSIQRAHGYDQLQQEVETERNKKRERYKLIKEKLSRGSGLV